MNSIHLSNNYYIIESKPKVFSLLGRKRWDHAALAWKNITKNTYPSLSTLSRCPHTFYASPFQSHLHSAESSWTSSIRNWRPVIASINVCHAIRLIHRRWLIFWRGLKYCITFYTWLIIHSICIKSPKCCNLYGWNYFTILDKTLQRTSYFVTLSFWVSIYQQCAVVTRSHPSMTLNLSNQVSLIILCQIEYSNTPSNIH